MTVDVVLKYGQDKSLLGGLANFLWDLIYELVASTAGAFERFRVWPDHLY